MSIADKLSILDSPKLMEPMRNALVSIVALLVFQVNITHGSCPPNKTSITESIEYGRIALRLTLLEQPGSASCPLELHLSNGTYASVSDGFTIAQVKEVFQGDAEVGDEFALALQDAGTLLRQTLPPSITQAGQDVDGFLAFIHPLWSEPCGFAIDECDLGAGLRPWVDVSREEKEFLRGLVTLPENPLTYAPTSSPTTMPTSSTGTASPTSSAGIGRLFLPLMAAMMGFIVAYFTI